MTAEAANGEILDRIGAPCAHGYALNVSQNGNRLGSIIACRERSAPHLAFFGALGAAILVLWFSSAFIARRLARPLDELERVTNEIGEGNLAARVRLGRHHSGEVGSLAESINEMAARIERQLREERALLAAVSHELRSPLARLRLLVELARTGDSGARRLDECEVELEGMDSLIGKLLSSSRLDFGELERTPLRLEAVAQRALEAANLSDSLLQVIDRRVRGVPSLRPRPRPAPAPASQRDTGQRA